MEINITPWYEIVLIIQLITMITICLDTIGIDTTGPFFIMAACGYLRSLNGRLEQLHNAKNHQKDFEKEITSCVIYHQQLLELVWNKYLIKI